MAGHRAFSFVLLPWLLVAAEVAQAVSPPVVAEGRQTQPSLEAQISRARSDWNKSSVELAKLLRQLKSGADALSRIEADVVALRKQLRDLEAEKIQALEDLREGAFCTGCGQTRSVLLAKGEPFPHPGQQSRPATPEELKKAEADYDVRLQRLRDRLKNREDEQKKAEGDLAAWWHRFQVLLRTYHAQLLEERDLRERDWGREKSSLETRLASLDADLAKALKQVDAAASAEAKDAATINVRIQRRQLDDARQAAASAESRARQQALRFAKMAHDDMASLAKLAAELPEKFGLPGGWYVGKIIRTPARGVEYSVPAVDRRDGASSAGHVRALLGESSGASRPGGSSPASSTPTSMKDLLEGK